MAFKAMSSEAGKVSHIGTLVESKTLPISLRNLQLEDAPAFARLLSDPRNSSDPNIKPMDVSTAETVIIRMRESASEPTIYDTNGKVLAGPGRVNLAVVLKSEDQPEGTMIGLGGYGAIKELERDGQKLRAGDVGVLIDADYRGKGYATEALKLAMDLGFAGVGQGGLQLDRITITTLDDNEPVIKLVNDKLGLSGKSVKREAEIAGKMELYWELKKGDWVKN
ncbi:GNAT domain-containing protein [Dactylonectria macrodidyma]|uniref:GNAT domain-containing protein n=1 Tax=Dactylonectria macrodidyma TaxID=307937 RepID=A0A9P9FKL6_9HYPO|nr:GNAT domain-containing protein [Dactylonectria macrodidyma]